MGKFKAISFKELLLSTGTARLVESATVDNEVNRFWGEVNGVGRNTLGIMLMELRDELRSEEKPRAKPATGKTTRRKAIAAVA